MSVHALSELLRAVLSWPVAFVLAVLIFRPQIADALVRLRKVNGGGVRLELERSLESARASAAQAGPRATAVPSASDADTEAAGIPADWESDARTDPSGLMMTAWATLEAAMRRAARATDDQVRARTEPRDVLASLQANGVVDAAFVDAAWNLRLARNTIAHAPDARPTSRQALSFAETVGLLLRQLPPAAR